MEEQNKHPQSDNHDSSIQSDALDSTASSDSLSENQEENLLFEEEAELLPIPLEIIEAEIAREEVDELYLRNLEANKVVFSFSAAAAATGAIPIPFADAPVLIAEQIAMLAKLSDVYSINLKRSGLKSLVFAALGVSGTTILGKTISGSLFKLIPGLGSIGGAAVNGTTAAALTAALGAAYGELCQKVFIGELDEKLLLSHEGKELLETSFKKHLRGELKKSEEGNGNDVLTTTPIPNQETPISLHTELTPEECGQPLTPEQENVHENLEDLADLIQNVIDQNASASFKEPQEESVQDDSIEKTDRLEAKDSIDSVDSVESKKLEESTESVMDKSEEKEEIPEELEKIEKPVALQEDQSAPKEEDQPVETSQAKATPTLEEPQKTTTSSVSHPKKMKSHSKMYSQEDIDRLVTLYTTKHEEDSNHDTPSFSFPSSKLQD